MIVLSWAALKSVADAKVIPLQYVEDSTKYHVYLVDGSLVLYCDIPKDSEECTTFEASYKPIGNRPVSVTAASFTAKNLGTKKLFARNTGAQYQVVTGANVLTYTATYPQVKMIGVEVVGCEALDTGSMKVYDTAQGTYSGVANALLNQFGYSINLPKDFYRREAAFDADLYQGMVVKIEYNSVSNKTVGINFIMNELKA
jgi:hypothetical protein